MKRSPFFAVVSTVLLVLALSLASHPRRGEAVSFQYELRHVGTYASGLFAAGAQEIAAHDPATQRLFVVNAQSSSVDILDIANPANPMKVATIDATVYGASANSVAVREGVVAVAIEAAPRTDPGRVVFFDTHGTFLNQVTVGALPDMLTFTPNGRFVLVANEGEPQGLVDPEGSISVIDVSGGLMTATVRTAGFAGFNGGPLPPGVRVYGDGTVAQDLEPEYIAVSFDSMTAWVTLQEANALAVIDIGTAAVTRLLPLGLKDHSLPGNGLDPSDRDGGNKIASWPVHGMYQPDGIKAFMHAGQTFLVTANEGDARDSEEIRVGSGSYVLDPVVFPNAATLKASANLGRLQVTKASGDLDGDGDFDQIHAFGARSFSIRTTDGLLVSDSGDFFERLTAARYPANFNASSDANTRDDRSDNKGPEPEGIDVGMAYGKLLAFVGLERIGGVAVFDIADPYAPAFLTYNNNRNFSGVPGTPDAKDLGPEGILFIKQENSPSGTPLVVTSCEVSGTTSLFELVMRPAQQ